MIARLASVAALAFVVVALGATVFADTSAPTPVKGMDDTMMETATPDAMMHDTATPDAMMMHDTATPDMMMEATATP